MSGLSTDQLEPAGGTPSLARTLADIHEVPGWLHDEQAGRLWDAARRVPEGGDSNRGRESDLSRAEFK